MTDHDHKHYVPGCYRCDLGRNEERESMLAELDALRARVGWLDHLDTPEGRAMHATEAVRVENEQLRADLREAMELLRAYGQPHYLVGLKEAIGWNASYRKLMEKHKETP